MAAPMNSSIHRAVAMTGHGQYLSETSEAPVASEEA